MVLGGAAVPRWADAGPRGVVPGSWIFVAPAVSLVEVMVFFFARDFFPPPVPSCIGFENSSQWFYFPSSNSSRASP